MGKQNNIASAQDFRRAAEERRSQPESARRVVLPTSGLGVTLCRPTPMWFMFHGRLPMSLAAKRQANGGDTAAPGIRTSEELAEFSKWMVELMKEVFVAPRLSMTPGPDEISPEWLPEGDVNFIIRWAVGEVEANGQDLADFRGKPKPAAAGPGGGNVSRSAQPTAETDGDGTTA